ncbi:MAG: hypothetical protein IPN76_27030 [Saprospiraceae bacterium]|nr:hypothetical protein [Saprospiraceae bacterium]
MTKEEFKYLGWFVKSNYFNTDTNLITMYEILKKYYPEFSSEKLEKERAFNLLFPGTVYDDPKMRNLMSKMTQLLEEYLVCLEWKQDKFVRERLLIDAFERRNIDIEESKKKTAQLISDLDNLPYRDENYFQSKMNLQRKLYIQSNVIGNNNSDYLIEDVLDNLDSYFALVESKTMCEIASLKTSKSSKIPSRQTKIIDVGNILSQIYSKICELYRTEDESIYLTVKDKFAENISTINMIEQKYVLKYLLEFAIRRVRINALKYLREVFELYKIAHENQLLAINGVITNTTFINIVNAAARVAEFEWAEKFILENLSNIDKETREEVEKLGKGFLAFNKRDFSQVVDLLSTLSFDDILYQLLAKSLSLQAYFELFLLDMSYFSFIKNYSQSFEKYISRNPEIGKRKSTSYLLFIRFVKTLSGLIHHNELTNEKRKNLMRDLENKTEIAERNWLRLKMESS